MIVMVILVIALCIALAIQIGNNRSLKKTLSTQTETARNLEQLYTTQKVELNSIKYSCADNSFRILKTNFSEYFKSLDDKSFDELIELAYESRVNDYDIHETLVSKSLAEDYVNDLSVIWAEDSFDIQFGYKDAQNNRTKRRVQLEEVSTNNFGEHYFIAFCMDKMDIRHFKVNRIISKIQFNGKAYSIEDFFSEVLFLNCYRSQGLANDSK